MFSIDIKNGQFYRDGKVSAINHCGLGEKTEDVFQYILDNNIDFTLERYGNKISVSPIRTDIKSRLYNALLSERLIRPRF